jgi:hypothetical protein
MAFIAELQQLDTLRGRLERSMGPLSSAHNSPVAQVCMHLACILNNRLLMLTWIENKIKGSQICQNVPHTL